ncbi:hypothetical protein OCT63_19765 [Vibrio sp. RW]|uniref:hypothetical protein n=1 Tax=Vibrio sp. RW TaxID=2998833 RepID=UPI0022CD507A|nr:hypothetical protein [Vibrio sp. RW]MDA0146467.1 hypothetical protein [Vibrio sp. RW]
MKTIIQNMASVQFADITGTKLETVDIRLMVIDDLPTGTFANCAIVHPETGMVGHCEVVANKALAKFSDALRAQQSTEDIILRGWETFYFHSLEQVAGAMDVQPHQLHDELSIRTMDPEEVIAC